MKWDWKKQIPFEFTHKILKKKNLKWINKQKKNHMYEYGEQTDGFQKGGEREDGQNGWREEGDNRLLVWSHGDKGNRTRNVVIFNSHVWW